MGNSDEIIDVRDPEFFQTYSFYLPKLPEVEKQLLGFVEKGLNQKEIARHLKVTQGAVSSRISRIKKRLRFFKKLYQYNWQSIDTDLGTVFSPFQLELVKGMIATTCQSETARRLNVLFNFQGDQKMTQVKVRHYFGLCIQQLKDVKKRKIQKANYLQLFNFVKKNLYMSYEVRLPHFDRRGV